jgi:hypothetical protein
MPDPTPDQTVATGNTDVSNTPPTQGNYYDSGVSDPQPDNGQISQVSPAAPFDDTVPQPQQPAQTTQPAQTVAQPGTVSNTPPTPASPNANHPAVQRAGLVKDIATALAGGERTRLVIDPNTGQSTRVAVPLSNRQIGLAIALEALSGGLAGLGAKGTNATGQAAALGLQQGQQIQQQRQEAQQADDASAQQDFNNQKTSLAQKASIAETNSRTILNTSEAESRGAGTIQKLADQNKGLIDDYDAAGVLQQRNVTQDELMDGMKSGKYNATEVLGPIDGYRLFGNGQVEATHALITNPTAKVPVTAEQWNSYADAGVPGWPKLAPGTSIPDGFKISGAQLASANEIKNAMTLAQARHDEVAKALQGSDNPDVQKLAANVPTIKSLMSDPQTSAGLATALERFQKYVSHSDQHGMDLYQSLQQMAQPTNPDSKYAAQVMQAFGGPAVLQAYHDEVMPLQIKNPDEAADMLTSNPVGSRANTYAKAWNRNHATQAAQEAAAKTGAEERVKASTAASTSPSTLVDQIGQGKIAAERVSQLLSRNPTLLEQVSQNYPDFDSSKAASYPKTYQDFTSGKTAQALNAGGTALQHLQELQALNTPASHIPGTPAYTAYQNKVDTVADELAKFYGNSTVSGIESYKKTLNSTLPGNRDAAIRTQAESMGAKMDSYETTWKNAAPSAAYQAPMPGISDKAKAARAALDPSYKNVPTPPQGATMKVPGSDGKMYWSDGKNILGVAQ